MSAQYWMKVWIFGVGLAIYGVLASTSTAGEASGPSLIELMRKHRQHIAAINAEWLGNTNINSSFDLKAFLRNLDNEAFNPPPEDLYSALHSLVVPDNKERKARISRRFIEDPKAIEVIVAALKEKSGGLHRYALDKLLWETRRKDLEQYAPVIKAVIGLDPKGDEELLLALLPLTQDEQNILLSQSRLSFVTRARLGDKEAERKLIKQFEDGDYDEKKNLARFLGCVGTPQCARALVDALQSPLFNRFYGENENHDYSIRIDVLTALGNIYQDELLFTREAVLLPYSEDDCFNRVGGKANYLKAVDVWVQERFGHSAWGEGEVWFVRRSPDG